MNRFSIFCSGNRGSQAERYNVAECDKKHRSSFFHRLRVGRGSAPVKQPQAQYNQQIQDKKILMSQIREKSQIACTVSDIISLQKQIEHIAKRVFKDDDEKLAQLKKKNPEIALDNQDRQVTLKEWSDIKKVESYVIDLITSHVKKINNLSSSKAKSLAAHIYKQEYLKYLNESPLWMTLTNTFIHNGCEYISMQRPAAEMKYGNRDIFRHSYEGKGVNCWDDTNMDHATNLWCSTFSVKTPDGQKKDLFSGIRHGVLSPYNLSDPFARKLGAENRAKEVLSAALYSKPELLERALKGETVPLRLVSTSLLTPVSFIGKEKSALKEQMHAWQQLKNQHQPIKLAIRVGKNQTREVKVTFDICAFNFGVNEAALKLGLGTSFSDHYNEPALKQLLGDNLNPSAEPGGWVGEYLFNRPNNAESVYELSRQIKEIWHNKSHHHDGNEPYKAAQRIAMLAYEMGVVPCWNCKSGKDRTGMLDAELKREVVSLHQGNPLSKPGSLPDSVLLQKVLLNSGNLEIQAINTGMAGNMILKHYKFPGLDLSYQKRIDDKDIWLQVKGKSDFIAS